MSRLYVSSYGVGDVGNGACGVGAATVVVDLGRLPAPPRRLFSFNRIGKYLTSITDRSIEDALWFLLSTSATFRTSMLILAASAYSHQHCIQSILLHVAICHHPSLTFYGDALWDLPPTTAIVCGGTSVDFGGTENLISGGSDHLLAAASRSVGCILYLLAIRLICVTRLITLRCHCMLLQPCGHTSSMALSTCRLFKLDLPQPLTMSPQSRMMVHIKRTYCPVQTWAVI
jgi:hypothetical protein